LFHQLFSLINYQIFKMKKSIPFKSVIAPLFALVLIIIGSSCKKDAVVTPIAAIISTVTSDATTLSDVQTLSCQLPDTIDVATVPSALTTYVSTNYAGYTTQFIYAVKTGATVTGYLANLVNGTSHMNIRFDATGTFVKALALPAHTGFAMFGTDTTATSALPAALTAYLAANSSTYAVKRIFTETDGSYTVIATQGTNAYALSYLAASPTALTVINLGAADFTTPNVDITTLPATVAAYINTNYSGATIERVIAETCSGASNGYTVIFKNSTTQYAAEFDSTGAFTEILKAN
jgi:Putative beta-lactamase-inhibitor-like, PepSY-like